jgi:hypothetical protein
LREELFEEFEEETIRSLTLGAFQGAKGACFALGLIHNAMVEIMKIKGADWRKDLLLSVYWYGICAELDMNDEREVNMKNPNGCRSLTWMAFYLDVAMTSVWHPRPHSNLDPLPGYSHVPFYTWALERGEKTTELNLSNPWKSVCANCGQPSRDNKQLKACARCKAFHYCSKKCQVEHWKAGHKVDCKGHWIEEFFPDIRKVQE